MTADQIARMVAYLLDCAHQEEEPQFTEGDRALFRNISSVSTHGTQITIEDGETTVYIDFSEA